MRPVFWMFLCFTLALNVNGQNQVQNNERTIHVKGVAILKQIPELISVTINLKTESKDYGNCHDKLMATLRNAKEIFSNNGINKDLVKTNEFRVSENKTYKNGEEIKLGFIGSVSLSIDTIYSVEFTKKLLPALRTDSISLSYSILFKLSESQKDILRKKAISQAIHDAMGKALLMAESAQVRLDKIKSIVYKDDNFVSAANDNDLIKEYSWNQDVLIRGVGYGTLNNTQTKDFNPKEIKIVKAVEIEYSIKDKTSLF
jgi:uncharacterized protein YggE